ncbi:unnamed protein product [Toxocara canis]|uniref:AcetylCoA_hyd_C domain-containing protein n=1 Tax=Toxocara canis TaxID=6265 RepID=A0A183ULF0_TOXCA|nr:unnamed protein product [Toxocara canis]
MVLISTPIDMISYPPLEGKRDGRTVGDRFSLNAVGNVALSYQNALMIHNHLRGIHPGRQVDNIIIPANMKQREPFVIARIRPFAEVGGRFVYHLSKTKMLDPGMYYYCSAYNYYCNAQNC